MQLLSVFELQVDSESYWLESETYVAKMLRHRMAPVVNSVIAAVFGLLRFWWLQLSILN